MTQINSPGAGSGESRPVPGPAGWSAEPWGDDGRLVYIEADTATKPASGECIVDHWWSVHPEKGVAFWYRPFGYLRSEDPSPQCNSSEGTARALNERLYPDHDIRFFPVVFVSHARRAMNADKQTLMRP